MINKKLVYMLKDKKFNKSMYEILNVMVDDFFDIWNDLEGYKTKLVKKILKSDKVRQRIVKEADKFLIKTKKHEK